MPMTAEEMSRQLDSYRAADPAHERATRGAAAERAQRIARNRAQCLEGLTELEPHRANVDQAQANVDALIARLEDLAPARVERAAVQDLTTATTAGDAEAQHRAATALQQIRMGADASAIERLQVEARLVQARADLASAEASLSKAEQAALGMNLAKIEKAVGSSVRAYQAAADDAFKQYNMLRQLARQQIRFAAALVRSDLPLDYDFLQRGPDHVELPAVPVPGHGTVRPVGRRLK